MAQMGMIKKSVGEMGWKVAGAALPTAPVLAKKAWAPLPPLPKAPPKAPEAAPPPTNYWDWLPEELQDEVRSHNVVRGLCGMPDWVAGGGPRVRYCVPPGREDFCNRASQYNSRLGDDAPETPHIPLWTTMSEKPQLVAVPPPEFWHSIHQEVERMTAGRLPLITLATLTDYERGEQPVPVALDPTESAVLVQHGVLRDEHEDDFHMWKTGNENWSASALAHHEDRRNDVYDLELEVAEHSCVLRSAGRYGRPHPHRPQSTPHRQTVASPLFLTNGEKQAGCVRPK